MLTQMRSIAFPSWVAAGGIAQNAAFICAKWQELNLGGKFGAGVRNKPEIGLCFFEHLACTAYTSEDLPQHLASLPASWHVHLPLDLPFYLNSGLPQARLSFDICKGLMEKVEFLEVKKAVLHPPTTASDLFAFIDLWELSGRRRADLLLENQPGDDLVYIFNLAKLGGCGLCLDLAHLYMRPQLNTTLLTARPNFNLPTGSVISGGVSCGGGLFAGPVVGWAADSPPRLPGSFSGHMSGHMFGHMFGHSSVSLFTNGAACLKQTNNKNFAPTSNELTPEFLQKVQMAHINALGKKQNGHASLNFLSKQEHGQYEKIILGLPKNSTLMLELFKWEQIEESIPLLAEFLGC